VDEQEALNSIMQDLVVLHRSSRPSGLPDLGKHKASSPKNQNDVRVKFEYRGEKRILQFPRPVSLEDLSAKAKVAFGQTMDLHYTNNELVIPLSTQDDLDKAVELLDRSVHMKSLKILLVLPSCTQNSVSNKDLLPAHENLDNTDFSAAAKKNMLALIGSQSTDRSSPPPGYIPDALQQVARNGSFTSINSEGEFIPESMDQMLDPLSMSSPENSASGSCPSLDIDTYPKSRMPRALSYPDNHQEFPEYDIPVFEKTGKGGTYPRRYPISFGLHDYSDGRKTFPRARRTQAHGFRSPVSFSPTEQQSPSTSSGSSIFTPELEEPGRRRRGSDIEPSSNPTLSVMDISPPSRSPRAPTNWRLGKLLGQGAFGRVFLCYDADTGRELAVKQVQFDPDSPETSKEVSALECEIQLLKNLFHERIVQYYGCLRDTHERTLSIFMEYMPGDQVPAVHFFYCFNIHFNLNVRHNMEGKRLLLFHCDFKPFKLKLSIGCTVVEMLTQRPPWAEYEAMAAIFKIATQPTNPTLPPHVSDHCRDFLKRIFVETKQRPAAEDLLRHTFVH
uniref:Mitogen-activated protein kinase kinase kinase 2-like n=1 Tax=Sinocyclocheilus rhinocerous TaxID=307959 RepID=A0A673GYQ6_9TELE